MYEITIMVVLGILQAVQETLNDRYNKSIFRNLNEFFWNPKLSWRNKYKEGNPLKGRKKIFWNINVPVQITDAFHMIKVLQVTGLAAIAANNLVEFVYLGIIFNVVFGAVYHFTRRDSMEVIKDHYPILGLFNKRIRA